MPAFAKLTTPSLDPARIDLWHFDLCAHRVDEAVLSDDERARAARLIIPEKRIQFLAGRTQLRGILSGYLDCSPQDLRLTYGPHGKPALDGTTRLRFNLSHSAERALLAVTADHDIGVDIEVTEPDRRFLDLAGRFFAADEHEALARLEPGAQVAGFYRAWACKEAYLKAWGTGLSFASNQFSIQFGDREPPVITATSMPGDTPGQWQLRQLPAPTGYAAALCHPTGARWLRHFAPATDLPPDPG